jgi:hypothetical protein
MCVINATYSTREGVAWSKVPDSEAQHDRTLKYGLDLVRLRVGRPAKVVRESSAATIGARGGGGLGYE